MTHKYERSGMEETVVRAKNGDRSALDELVSHHYARVYRFCARRLGDDLAQDAAQETFLTIQRTIHKFQSRSTIETWMLGIAHNHCRNLSRKKMRDPMSLDETFDWPTPAHDDTVVLKDELRKALGKLTPEHREVVFLHEVEGLTYSEVAQITGVPEGTVKSRLFHAFKNLRDMMSEAAQ